MLIVKENCRYMYVVCRIVRPVVLGRSDSGEFFSQLSNCQDFDTRFEKWSNKLK